MEHNIFHADQNHEAFDLNQIFIGRKQQFDLFDIYLHRWKDHIFRAKHEASFVTSAPSPDNKIQGLLVLLHGRGGYGKSTLLRHYRERVLKENQHSGVSKVTVSDVVDWEFAIEGNRAIFHPPPDQEVDAVEYYKILYGQLVQKLGKEPKDFKEYQSAVHDIERARKEATGILDNMQRDSDRYGWLRGLAVEAITSALRTYVPGSAIVLDNPSVKKGIDVGAKLTQEQLGHIYTRLRGKLGDHLADYLDPMLCLGLALGRDLNRFARSYPLLIFFDTYEEIDEGDVFLRVSMGAAGQRVGWVIAGRDNLWAGPEQRARSIAVEYGYKELVSSDLGLSIDFNASDIGAFTLSDIMNYFDLLSEKISYDPPLSRLTKEEAARVLYVTQGIPLAVKIAAGLYMESSNLDAFRQEEDGQREIIDQMVRRYLLHTRASQAERAKLYGLALLRRADQPAAVAAALGLSPEQAKTSYTSTLSQLHRRYSFIFSGKEQPTLHQEVRLFLRLWLLEHCEQPEIAAINRTLRDAHERALKLLENHRRYSTLKARLADERWTATYLDLTEQQFWFDSVEGVRYLLPFTIAASIYNMRTNRDAAKIGDFFFEKVGPLYRNWLVWVARSLIYPLESGSEGGLSTTTELIASIKRNLDIMLLKHGGGSPTQSSPFFTSKLSSQDALKSLEELVKLGERQHLAFPSPLPDYHQELEAALWWRLATLERNRDIYRALELCEKALIILGTEVELKEITADISCDVGKKLIQESKLVESLPFLNRAVELKPDDSQAHITRGEAFGRLREYEQAIADYDTALKLDPNNVFAYAHRASVYARCEKYEQAIKDCNHALGLIGLPPSDLSELSIGAPFRSAAAALYTIRGESYRILRNYERAIEDINWAIELAPDFVGNYETRGYIYLAGFHDPERAKADYSRCCELDPTNINAAWMAEWTGMGRQRVDGLDLKFVVMKLLSLAAGNTNSYTGHVCLGVALGLDGKVKDGLARLEQLIPLAPERYDAYFWKGMLYAYFYQGRFQKALEAIEKAIERGMSPALLTPLYWFEKEKPEFFDEYAKPLLARFKV